MKVRVLLSTLVPVLLTSIAQPTIAQEQTTEMACVNTNETEIAQLFDRWNQSLQTGDPDKVVENYADDAILLPTVSNIPRTNHEEIKDYFEHFLQKKPVGVINMHKILIGCNLAVDNGLYTFTLTQNGKQVRVPARYSFEYQYINGKWLIVGHHSSVMPEQFANK
jgi:uncharacterized protein (TIGR02246 family)